MATITINGQNVEIGGQENLNVVQAARRAGVEIPHYCWHPALTVVASCRMCLVELGERRPDGSVVMQGKLFPACQTPVKDGMVIVTNSPKVRAAQQATLEYLLLNHPLDCPICDQAGECFLQDYSYRYGRAHSRLQEPKLVRQDKHYIGDHIVLFTDRCVMCTRCVRFTREISGTGELQVIHRGSREEIDIFPGHPCNNKLAGNVVDICPVGALCSTDFLYQQRVWWLKSSRSVCPRCSTGCSLVVDQNRDHVYRLRPRANPQAQGYFLCDEGRFGFDYIHDPQRLKQPLYRRGGETVATEWQAVLPALRGALAEAVAFRPSRVAAVLSPWMTCEEAYLAARYLKGLSPEVRLALGPVRRVGDDDRYPKDVHGRAIEPAKFVIRAEKCPNRRGVERILEHFAGAVLGMEEVLAQAAGGQIETLYLFGGDPVPWITAEQAAGLGRLKLLVVQDILPSPASTAAHFVLPGGSFAEREGTVVNHAGLAQALQRAVQPPDEAWPDLRILWQLTGRRGLFHASALRQELAQEIPAFAPLTVGELGELGVFV
jgi:NADH-quinone oxidoreductase subunit G